MQNDLAGLLPVDKPEGPTSHDIVNTVRRITGLRRVGHTGTLDPFASGLLLVCVGWATRLAEYLSSLPKSYRGCMRLGERTDTDDRTGEVIERDEAWRQLDAEQLRSALESLVGSVEQRPPSFSARKVAGRRAYRVARAGGILKLDPRHVTIHRLDLEDLSPPHLSFQIECSSGTYVRAVARDVGEAVGVGAHLADLRRTRVGDFLVEDALQLGPETTFEVVAAALRPPEEAVAHLPVVELGGCPSQSLGDGQPVPWADDPGSGPLAIRVAGQLVAIGEWREGRLWPRKVLRRR